MSKYLTLDQLKFSGGVILPNIMNANMYGTDITVGILRSNFDILIKDTASNFRTFNFTDNISIKPGVATTNVCSTALGNNAVYVILFNSKSHLNAVIKASSNLQDYPKYLLDDAESYRAILRKELLNAGFMHISIIKEIITGPYRAIKRLFN